MSQGTRPLSSSSPQSFRNARTAFPKASQSREPHIQPVTSMSEPAASPALRPTALSRAGCRPLSAELIANKEY
jgi:hypothetical protein